MALAAMGYAFLSSDLFAKVVTHKVLPGDTLNELAVKYGSNVNDIRRVNRLKDDRIQVGKHLIIPVPDTYQYIERVVKTTQDIRIEPGRWKYIVTHHSAIEQGNAESYGAYHKRRGMENGLAYHFVIGCGLDSGNGQVEIGPRWLKQQDGGHVRTDLYNQIGIGICMVGNFQVRKPTQAQMGALYELVDYLSQVVQTKRVRYAVHKEIDPPGHTVCPGRNFPLAEYHKRLG